MLPPDRFDEEALADLVREAIEAGDIATTPI
jgi:hypothetical protein